MKTQMMSLNDSILMDVVGGANKCNSPAPKPHCSKPTTCSKPILTLNVAVGSKIGCTNLLNFHVGIVL